MYPLFCSARTSSLPDSYKRDQQVLVDRRHVDDAHRQPRACALRSRCERLVDAASAADDHRAISRALAQTYPLPNSNT